MDECGISDQECEYIALALKVSNFMVNLSLKQNRISSKGVDSISDALCSSSCELESLDLSDNQINDECGDSLLKALQNSPSLQRVVMKRNRLQEIGEKLLDIIKLNRNIQRLDLQDNKIHRQIIDKVEDQLVLNR